MSRWTGRGQTGAGVALAWLLCGALPGCIAVPEPLELPPEDEDEDAWRSAEPAPAPVRMASDRDGPDYEVWPRSSEPWLASLDEREVRTYPLWPTPITEPCPTVMFGSYAPQLEGGDMFERVTARLGTVGEGRLRVSPSEITLLHDHVNVHGLRLVAASDTRGGCMMGWSHTHCFVSATHAYCPDGTTDDLVRLVRDHRLEPTSLDRAGWFELAVVMSGAESIVIEPALVRECTRVPEVEALPPTVVVEDAQVTVRFTAITEGDGIDTTVIIGPDGRVTMKTAVRWVLPDEGEQ